MKRSSSTPIYEILSAAELQGILAFLSRYDVDAFLKKAGADLDNTWQDLEEDLQMCRDASRRRSPSPTLHRSATSS